MPAATPTSRGKRALACLKHPVAGRLVPLRWGVRSIAGHTGRPPEVPPAAEFSAEDLVSGAQRLVSQGGASLELETRWLHQREAATVASTVRNVGQAPVYLDSLILAFRWCPPTGEAGASLRPLRFLRHGWQSWSYTGVRELDPAGEPEFPSGAWLRGMHHARNAPPPDRAGWHESATVSVVGRAGRPRTGVCLAGALETGRAFVLVYLRECGDDVEVEIEQLLETSLAPGELCELEDLRIALGDEPSRLLEAFAALWGAAGGARTRSPFQLGWCSWYYFFHDVTQQDLLRNLDALAAARDSQSDGIPIDVVQLDDGYQRAIGDWLVTNEKFPGGLALIAKRIRDAGFRAGIWTAPFCVVPESLVFQQHPEWLLRWGEKPFNATVNPPWTKHALVNALDPSRDDVQQHLRAIFSELVALGFDYLKLDFLHAVAMLADSAHPEMTRAARLRVGLEAIREGAGDDALLLGCGSPLGPAVGIVDAMRIGPDVAPHWGPPEGAVPGIEPALPSTRNAVRSVLCRSFMHRRLWLNDPDCLMVRGDNTDLSADESNTLATAIAATGGMLVMSDDVPALSAAGRALLRDTARVAREVDAASEVGVARCDDLLASETPGQVWSPTSHASGILALLNTRDSPDTLEPFVATRGQAEPLLATRATSPQGVALAAHESALFRLRDARELAVFCDFDGTFSLQDVGATIADQHAGKRRAELRERFLRGEVTAWESNMELLDGLALPEPELDEFLQSIDLDPGAAALLAWCDKNSVAFEILSDGFDYNLDRLQEIHGVQFRYAANRLRYQDGRWRIAPGHPNAACGCGTGTCKRTRIDAYRASHPGAFCVHIGNGQVSDLCGALAADLTFAKDTLASALEARGERYIPYSTLHEVVARLAGEP